MIVNHQTLVDEKYVRVEDVVPTLLVYPKEFNIQILPNSLKDEVRKRMKNHLEWLNNQSIEDEEKMEYVNRQYRNILTFLSHDGDQIARDRFPEKIQGLDALRESLFSRTRINVNLLIFQPFLWND
jgi:hypothetical protein